MKGFIALSGLLCLLGCGSAAKSVRIDLPLPPRLDLAEYNFIYFPGFISDVKNEGFDSEREAINFFKQEFARKDIMSIVEENPVDLSQKDPREFFKKEQPYFKSFNFKNAENSLALTGVVSFEVVDRSGFREVERTDITGRRYYRTQFVEITGFNLSFRIFVYDIATGKLLHSNLLRDTIDIEGENVDQRLVYYDLLNRISGRILGLFTDTIVKGERSLL